MSYPVNIVSQLTVEQHRAISLLSTGLSQSEVAMRLNVSTRTIQRWLLKPEFSRAIQQVADDTTRAVVDATVRDTTEELKRLAPKTVLFVESILDDPDARTTDRLRAADLLGRWSGLSTPPKTQDEVSPRELSLQLLNKYLQS